MIYLDNAATTCPCRESVEAVMQGLEQFGNPSSLHGLGLRAEQLREKAREQVAHALGALPEEIFFTSCATESSNTAIFGVSKSVGKRKKRIITTSVEHPSVAVCINTLEEQGFEVIRLRPDENGEISADDIISAVDDNTCLVSCMLVNNETGTVFPVGAAFKAIKKNFPQTITHCDCVQGFLKRSVRVKDLSADIISLSAHKIHGPNGIGANFIRKGVHIPAFILGGGQEKGFRSGTESVPLIMGFGAACEKYSGAIAERYAKMSELKKYFCELCQKADGVFVNSREDASPYIVSISVKGLKSEPLLHFLEQREIYVSSGSACSKGKKSTVISEFHVPSELADSVLRISFSGENTREDIDALMAAISEAQNTLAKLRK